MIDLLGMIRTAIERAGPGGIALAAPFDLSDYHCRTLVTSGAIQGYVAAQAPRAAPAGADDPYVCGWWAERGQRLFLRAGAPSTLLLLSARAQETIATQVLLEAHLKGVRRMLFASLSGTILREIEPGAELAALLDPAELALSGRNDGYEQLFELLFELLGDSFEQPADVFVPNRVMLMLGTLGPGGAERQTAYTAIGLARRGYDVFVACNNLDPPRDFFRTTIEQAGCKVVLVPGDTSYHESPKFQQVLSKLAEFDHLGARNIFHAVYHYAMMLGSVRPSLLHAWMDYCTVLGGIAAQLVGVPSLVLSGRNVAPDNFPTLYQPYMRPGYLALLDRRPAVFLNNSSRGAKDYARWLEMPEAAFRVVHNGVVPASAPADARSTIRQRYGIPGNALVVGALMRFAEEKNPRLFIDAARLLHATHPWMRFLMFGVGPMLEEIHDYVVETGLAGTVVIPGIATDAWEALAAFDVFLLTSRLEGLPNVLIEAQAAGVPVVCTAVGGSLETLDEGKTGFAVSEQTPDAIAHAVARLCDDPYLLARMSEQAKRFARSQFGVERMVAETVSAYGEAAARGAAWAAGPSYQEAR